MATNSQLFESRVLLNDKQAKQQLAILEADLKRVTAERKKAFANGEDLTAFDNQIKQINASIKTMRTNQEQVNNTLKNLSTASYKELQVAMRDIQKQLRSGAVARNSAEWKELQTRLKEVKREMTSINNEAKEGVSLWGRVVGFFNQNWGAIDNLVSAWSGLSMTVRQCAQDYADMEEAMANVRKYTGQTDEQVHQMNEDFKHMDTRTSREALNELAGAAGRLGITSQDMIEEFVDGADKINVALGDDLGKGAVDKIGKLAQMFGEDKTKGLRGAMLATGSAVNELAQNSSANAGYIVDFAADLSGVGVQAGMTQAQLMGLASALDQNMQEEATSATVFSQLITKMYQDPARFAKIAGVQVKKFSDLMKNDANAALMQFLEAMRSKGGFADMAPMFEDMKLDGTRAVGVLSAVASHLDQVKVAQDLANQSYQDGTSVLNEFNVQNSTVQAEIDKAKKRFNDLSVELGEKLLPVTKYAISTASLGVSVLSTLINFTIRHAAELATLGAAITVCTALYKAHAIAIALASARTTTLIALEKAYAATTTLLRSAMVALQATWALLTKGVQGYIVVMRAARLASLTNPWGALATALTVVGVAIYGVVKAITSYSQTMHDNLQSVKEYNAVQQAKNAISKQSAEATAEERAKIEQLNKIIHSNVYTVGERRSAIAALQKIVPAYHAQISNEGKLYKDNQQAIKDYIVELERAAMAEAIYARKVEINKKKLSLEYKESRIQGSIKAVDAERQAHPDKYASQKETVYRPGNGMGISGNTVSFERNQDLLKNLDQRSIHEQRLRNTQSELKVIEAEDKYLDKVLQKDAKLAKLYTQQATAGGAASTTTTTTPTSTGGSTYTSEKERKRQEKERKRQEKERKRQEKERKRQEKERADDLKMAYDRQRLQEDLSYQKGEVDLRTHYLNMQRIEQDYIDARKAAFGTDTKQYQKALNDQLELDAEKEKKSQDIGEKNVEAWRTITAFKLKAMYYDPNSDIYHNQKALNEALYMNELSALSDRQALYREGSDEYEAISTEIEELEGKHKLEKAEEYELRKQAIIEAYQQSSAADREAAELKELNDLYEQNVLSTEEYEKLLQSIRSKYFDKRSEEEQQSKQQDKGGFSESTKSIFEKANMTDAVSGNRDNLLWSIGGYAAMFSQLKKAREDDLINQKEYDQAMSDMWKNLWENMPQMATQALSAVSDAIGAVSAYTQACSDLEVARIEKNYEKQINAAGNNSAKKKRLEDKRDKEIAKAKTKANKKAMVMEMAQAIAQTASAALNAYTTTMAGAPYPANLVLAPISAGIALAAGMLQVATIKKQHQAQAAGYYSGGFTGGSSYRREAGVVHEGEFVANHQAVNNPQLLPALRLIDMAQRNNTVASLTADDVSRAMGTGGSLVAPVVNVTNDNEEVRSSLDGVNEAVSRLSQTLDDGIEVELPISGRNGLYRRLKDYQKMLNNK